MTPLSHRSCCVAAGALSVALCPAASAQYTGNGFLAPTPHQDDVVQIEILDLDADGLTDFATLDSAGDLYVHFDALSLQRRQVEGPFTQISVTRNGVDRLWGLSNTGLHEILPSLDGLTWDEEDAAVVLDGPTRIDTYESAQGSRITVVEDGGATVRRFLLDGDALVPDGTWGQSLGFGAFHDAATIDWYGTGVLCVATITDNGLKVLEPDGDLVSVNGELPGVSDGALIEVVRGAELQHGHDLLIHLYRPTLTDPAPMVALNAFHVEMLNPDSGVIGSIDSGRILGSPYTELIFKRSDEPTAYVFKHQFQPDEAGPYFVFDPFDESVIDFSASLAEALDGGGGGGSRPTATADVDHDGDVDLVAVNEFRELQVMTSTEVPEDFEVRVWFDDTRAAKLVPPTTETHVFFDPTMTLPPDATGVAWEVRVQDDIEAELDDAYLQSGMVTPSGSPFTLTINVPKWSGASGDEVYQFLFRAFDASGGTYQSRIAFWSPSSVVQSVLGPQTALIYPWLSTEEDLPGGTVRRPLLGPPISSH